jgi:protein-disulfide isomerase
MNTTPTAKPAAKSLVFGLLTFALLMGGFLLPACSAQEGGAADSGSSGDDGSKVLAKVDGKEITRQEVLDNAKAQMEQAEAQLTQCQANYERAKYQIVEASVREMVDNALLDAEAAKRGISRDELVAAEVDGMVAEVTDEDVDTWYNENQARLRGAPKEQIAPQIKQFLTQQRQQEAHDNFIKSLKEGSKVALYLEPPRTEVETEGHPAKGPENAPVTIVEFSDFECPFCSRVVPTLEQVEKEYGDKVRIVFRQYPLPMHPNAPKAAEASLCAQEQGKFWEMHDAMFADQRGLGVDALKAKAAEIGLDTEKFNQCLDSGQYAEAVQADMQAGQKAGVTGTPAMFVNGRLVSGAVPFENIAEVIDAELDLHAAKAEAE